MELADLVALSLAPGIRRRVFEAARAADALGGGLQTALEVLQPDGGPTLASDLGAAAARALNSAAHQGITAVAFGHPQYPPLLAAIADPPLVLWVRGDSTRLGAPAVAIVGSRAASHGSREIAGRLGADLAARGLVVVSGLARGCDGAAHEGAVACGMTLAVLGSGPDVIYPPEHDALAARIVARGALLAELPPGTPPLPHHFPLRNRIISGLSLAVIVIEAGDRSGSLITAGCALEQGRDVMAVPGGVIGGRHRGGHALLRDGARLVETADDVLEELAGRWPAGPAPGGTPSPDAGAFTAIQAEGLTGIRAGGANFSSASPPMPSTPQMSPPDDPVASVLRPGDELDVDDVVAVTGLAPTRVLARLGELELQGRCVRLPGGRYVWQSGKVIT